MLEFPAALEGVVSLFREGKFGLSFSGKFYIKMENTEAGDPRKVEYHRNFFFETKSLSMAHAALNLGSCLNIRSDRVTYMLHGA